MPSFRKRASIIALISVIWKLYWNFDNNFDNQQELFFLYTSYTFPLIKSTANDLKWNKPFRVELFRLNVSAADNTLWKGEKLDYWSNV